LHTVRITNFNYDHLSCVNDLSSKSQSQKIKDHSCASCSCAAWYPDQFIFMKVAGGSSLKPTQLVNIPNNIFKEISFPDFTQLFSKGQIWKDGVIIKQKTEISLFN